jgi:tRNA(Ile)-lysidine synthetase, N-terminal domain/tRNA(Ile)-lysidine synthetase, C-terminal domain
MTVSSTGSHHPLHKQVAQVVRVRGLLQPGQKVLVAVSGGPDSVALLSILHDLAPGWALSLTVVHCNYGLRGAESDGDASFVTALCRRLEIPCLVKLLTADRREAGASSSLQARARESRYRLFRELAGELGAERVALGHNADDQAETVLLRMLRGAGLRGLAGMPHIRERLFIRPLLSIARQEILSYLQAVGLSYRTDSSNAKPIYLRNRVRHELLPVIQDLAPAAVRMLARQADILREDDRLLSSMAVLRLMRIVRIRDEETMVLDRAALLEQPAALQRRMLRRAIQALAPSIRVPRSDQLMSLLTSLASPRSGGVWRFGSVRIASEPSQLRLTTAPPPYPVIDAASGSESAASNSRSDDMRVSCLPWTGSWRLTGEFIHIRTVTREAGLALLENPSSAVAIFDAGELSLPLKIRAWQPGDWFCPTGMAGRRKKLQDYFTDAKLGRSVREQVPLMLSRESIAWIVGQRADARFAATSSTTRFIVAHVTDPLQEKECSSNGTHFWSSHRDARTDADSNP